MKRPTHRKLSFQQLENRLTMAGNVIASVSSHSLYLTGDSRANNLEIIQVGNGQYQVTGKDGTTINGQAQKTFSGVTADLIANLNGGNDTLKIGYYAEMVTVPTTVFNRDVKVDPSFVLNASAGYSIPAGSVVFRPQVYVDNVFDHKYLLKGAFFSGASYGRPRSVQVRMAVGI